ncbi:hypothetical protein vBAbaMPhT2_024 [Acinetobacter phage vB_AbaM_PhT2]|uniref:Uncharacterized protein n=1 Tax=Acinetobacter phage vB_AbaM_PhT2 TaxID=2690230 RepID=A0A6B9SVG1_9CAUD|nr:hypothetical protein HYQ24_gp024 [Acinetobacter phage vB_AbaM_PhT2]QHJ75636.1 hypothetical protein vBAbaMPhT2_024 [Acinetobacter phage vB_AbaM_PhT2]
MKTPKIENVVVKIVRATESSGNVQYWVRATRTDDNDGTIFGNNLEYHCSQTAYNGHVMSTEDCIDRAVFSAKQLLSFFGHTVDDLVLHGFPEEELELVKSSRKFWRLL